MPKITFRRGLWVGVALLVLIVLPISTYVLTRTLPGSTPLEIQQSQYDLPGELKRAKQLPQWAELTQLSAKQNQPLTPAGMDRAGALTTHPNFFIRILALGVLGNSPDELKTSAAALVAARMKDENVFVRLEAMNVLGRLRAREYLPELRELLNSSDPDDRSGAKHALGMFGDGG